MAPSGGRTERVVVEVRCEPTDAELLADRLFALGASAVAEQPDGLVADLTPDAFDRLGGSALRFEFDHRVVEVDPAWADGWRRHAGVWRAGGVVLRPPWVDTDTGVEETEVVLDPGDAFGSGSHPSTRACLELMAAVLHGGERVLDVGCGSGVLSVAALRLGAASALGVDIDPVALDVSRRVAAANGVADRLEVTDRPLAGVVDTAAEPFDLVLANLLIPVIEELGADLADAVRPGGTLVVGGLLVEHRHRAIVALAPFAPEAELTIEGWVTLRLVRR